MRMDNVELLKILITMLGLMLASVSLGIGIAKMMKRNDEEKDKANRPNHNVDPPKYSLLRTQYQKQIQFHASNEQTDRQLFEVENQLPTHHFKP